MKSHHWLDNNLVPIRQAIIHTNFDPVQQRIYAALEADEFIQPVTVVLY